MVRKELRYKNEKVCLFEMDEKGFLFSIPVIFHKELLPLGICKDSGGNIDTSWIREWWKNNAIPAERDSIRLGLECIGVSSSEELKLLSRGLSLTNHYWLADENELIKWEDVNFWNNGFSEEVGEALFNHRPLRNMMFSSPDPALNGQLRKKWISKDGRFWLVKSGSSYIGQEVFNEKLASDLFEAAGVAHVEYKIGKEKDMISLCQCMTSKQVELISAAQLFNSIPRIPYPAEKELDYFYRLMDAYHIQYDRKQINDMLCIDYMMANTDRHYNNISFLYHCENDSLSLAPVFDNGTSMWSSIRTNDINVLDDDIMARPFCNKNTFGTWEAQKHMITAYPDLKPEDIMEALLDFAEALLKNSDMETQRVFILASGVFKRARQLQELLMEKDISISKELLVNENGQKLLEKNLKNKIQKNSRCMGMMDW